MIADPCELTADDAQELTPRRRLDIEEFLHGEAVTDVAEDRGTVVEPVGVGNGLVVITALAFLLEAAMEEADLDIGVDDGLAIEIHHDAHGAVRRRMRRADLHAQQLGIEHAPAAHELRQVGGVGMGVRQLRAHCPGPDERLALLLGIVLAQRISLELIVQVDPAQVRVAAELDAVHVVGFPLQPVCADPDRRHAGNDRVLVGHARLQPQPMMMHGRQQMVDDFKARPLADVIHRRHVDRHVEAQMRILFHEAGDIEQAVRRYAEAGVAAVHTAGEHIRREALAQAAQNGMRRHVLLARLHHRLCFCPFSHTSGQPFTGRSRAAGVAGASRVSTLGRAGPVCARPCRRAYTPRFPSAGS